VKTFLIALVLSAACGAAVAAPEVPEDSLYRLTPPLTDQAGKAATLDRYAGQPVVVTMFYGSCPHVCPMLIATIQRFELGLPEANRKRLRVLMVSLDPARDTPAHLTEVAQRHRADLSRWTFARAAADDVRRLAAALNIQYRQLPDGEFNHATVITLLDPQGRIVTQTSALLRLEPEFSAALEAATR
jgi:protein SCO1